LTKRCQSLSAEKSGFSRLVDIRGFVGFSGFGPVRKNLKPAALGVASFGFSTRDFVVAQWSVRVFDAGDGVVAVAPVKMRRSLVWPLGTRVVFAKPFSRRVRRAMVSSNDWSGALVMEGVLWCRHACPPKVWLSIRDRMSCCGEPSTRGGRRWNNGPLSLTWRGRLALYYVEVFWPFGKGRGRRFG
jgi:hypothetical protein